MNDTARRLPRSPGSVHSENEDVPPAIYAALRGLRYGTVTIVIQDGVIVQVERTEKLRLARQQSSA